MNVLVAVDMGPGSEKVLAFAGRLAKQTGGEVYVVHVLSEEEESRRQGPGDSQHADVMLEETRRDLEKSLEEIGMGQSSFAAIARVGEPVDEIQRVVAENEVDVVVAGMRRRSRVGKFLLGSDLQELLLSSDLPVVAVPVGVPA